MREPVVRRALASLITAVVLLVTALAAGDDDPYVDAPQPKPTSSAAPALAPVPAPTVAPAAMATSAPSPVPAPGVCTETFDPNDPYADLPQIKTAQPPWVVQRQRQKLYEEGQQLVQQGHLKEALDKLREVNRIRSEPRVLLWMGFPLEKLGCLVEAKRTYTQARDDAEKLSLKQEQQDADDALRALAPTIPRLVLHLPNEPGVVIGVDAHSVDLVGGAVEVNPGKHEVLVAWPNRLSFHYQAEAKVGQPTHVNVVIPQLPAPPPAPSLPQVPCRATTGCGCPMGDASSPVGSTTPLMTAGFCAALTARRRRGSRGGGGAKQR